MLGKLEGELTQFDLRWSSTRSGTPPACWPHALRPCSDAPPTTRIWPAFGRRMRCRLESFSWIRSVGQRVGSWDAVKRDVSRRCPLKKALTFDPAVHNSPLASIRGVRQPRPPEHIYRRRSPPHSPEKFGILPFRRFTANAFRQFSIIYFSLDFVFFSSTIWI